MKIKAVRLIGLLTIASSACALHARTHVGIGLSFGVPAPIVVRRAPPQRVVERVVAAPGPGYVWLPGRYSWGGNGWVWIAGAWVVPPRPDARWVDGVWNPQNQQWIEGHWEVPASAPVVMTPPPAPYPNEVFVNDAPPAPVVEVRTAAPGPGYVWLDGYWGWEAGRRQWFRGHWERPPHGYRSWVNPRWEHRGKGYVFVRGYWH